MTESDSATKKYFEPPLVITSSRQGRPNLQFQSVEDLRGWVNEQLNGWRWINDAAQSYPEGRPVIELQLNPLNEIQNICNQLTDARNDSAYKQARENVQNLLAKWLNAHGSIDINSSEGAFVISVKDNESPTAAIKLLRAFNDEIRETLKGRQINQLDSERLVAYMRVALFKLGIQHSAEPELVSLKNTATEFSQILSNVRNELAEMNRQRVSFENNYQKSLETSSDELSREKQIFLDSIAEIKVDTDKKIEALIHTMNIHTALNAPVSYWNKRGTTHLWCAIGFGLVSLLFALATLVLVMWRINFIWAILSNPEAGKLLENNNPLIHFEYFFVILIVIVGLWITKVFVRILLAHFHALIEARERSTMLSTYTSLLNDPNSKAEDGIKLMLEALFRPSSISSLKDESMPHAILEAISRKLS